MQEVITIRRPPSVATVLKWVGRLGRHENFGERMTGEEAHKAAAIFCAANHALKRDLLGKSWQGNRHLAAKCGELFERLTADAVFSQSNYRPQVDVAFC